MPGLNGFGLRDKVYNNAALHLKCIPFLFLSTGSTPKIVVEAYSKAIQGFFVKPNSFEQLESTIRKIVEYWQECVAPDFDSEITHKELVEEHKNTL